MSKDSKTRLVGRDSRTGAFISVKEARGRATTTVVERVPKPGYGDSSVAIVESTADTYKRTLKRLAKR